MNSPNAPYTAPHRQMDLEVYHDLFDSMPCIVSVQDRNFRLIKVNRTFEKEFGSRIGEHCYEVYKGRNRICPECSVESLFHPGKRFCQRCGFRGLLREALKEGK